MSIGRLAAVTAVAAVALIAGFGIARSWAPDAANPRYVFVAGQGLWRANPVTGEVSFCAPKSDGGRELLPPLCSPWAGGPQ